MDRVRQVNGVAIAGLLAAASALASPALGTTASTPPPPPWFDPSMVRYVGDAYGNPRASAGVVHVGAIDGSDMEVLEVPGAGAVGSAAGRRLLVQADRPTATHPGRRSLLAIGPDGTETVLLPSLFDRWTIDIDGDSVLAVSGDRSPDPRIWRIPVEGGAKEAVGLTHPRPSVVVVSPDGRSIAAGSEEEPYAPITAVFDGGPQRRLGRGIPLGFDARGRLIRLAGDVEAFDPQTGRTQRLMRAADYDGDGYVTRDGAAFIAATGSDGILIVDLLDGDRHVLRLPPADDGAWTVYRTGDDRYVVAIRTTLDLIPDLVAIHDRWEGWTGFLPWQGDERDRQPD